MLVGQPLAVYSRANRLRRQTIFASSRRWSPSTIPSITVFHPYSKSKSKTPSRKP